MYKDPKEFLFEKQHIVIGIPTTGFVNWQFASCLRTLEIPSPSSMVWTVRTMIDSARNMIVDNALKIKDMTHLFMVDDDHTFNPDLLLRLMLCDVDMVGLLLFKRNDDFQPCCYVKKGDGYFPFLPTFFQEVDAIGTGAVLIKRHVLESILEPRFETYYEPGKPDQHWSVDFVFSKKVKEAGFKIHVDPEAEIGHLSLPQVTGKNNFLDYLNKTPQAPWKSVTMTDSQEKL